jgi:hypothetical protein
MPRPGPERQIVAMRLDAGTIAAIDEAAARLELNRSETIRRILAVGLAHPEQLGPVPLPPG